LLPQHFPLSMTIGPIQDVAFRAMITRAWRSHPENLN
jgi:hypothetical protein